MQIGPYTLANKLILAPMAGISDRPFRNLCSEFGAAMTVSEMVASNPALRNHKRTLQKTDHTHDSGIRSIQILGTNPLHLAEAAKYNAAQGAQIIDINMGCPAKKVCSVAAGSALLRDESLVAQILDAVVKAVDIPVTLKIRTGWDTNSRNALTIAKIAEQAGISALTIHGRTRACKFTGHAEYDTIKAVKQAIQIPIIANGDISSPEKALQVLNYTGADAIMIGRAAQGNPWLFKQINHFINNDELLEKPDISSVQSTLLNHLHELYSFYGNLSGVRIARKHIGWYFKNIGLVDSKILLGINQANNPTEQIALTNSAISLLTTDKAA